MKKALFVALCLCVGVSLATAQVTLTFNPGKGEKYLYETSIVQDITQNVMGQDIATTQQITMMYTMDILDKTSDGVVIDNEFKDIFFETKNVMMSMKYDSKNPSANPGSMDGMIAKIFNALLGKKFQMVIGLDGTVKSVTGMEAIIEEMIKATDGDMTATQLAESMKGQFSDDAMKKAFEQTMKIFPSKAVSVGDSWNIDMQTTNAGIGMSIKSVYTVAEIGDKYLVANVKSNIDGMNGQLTGDQKATVKFDIKTGLPIESNADQDIEGTISAEGMEIPMSSKSKVSVKVEKYN